MPKAKAKMAARARAKANRPPGLLLPKAAKKVGKAKALASTSEVLAFLSRCQVPAQAFSSHARSNKEGFDNLVGLGYVV